MRTSHDPAAMAERIRGRAQRVAPGIPIFRMLTFDSIIAADLSSQRFNAMLFGAHAVIALSLAAIGVYGLLAYIAGQRTREMGVRMAIGARRSSVVGMVLRHGLRLGTIGVLIGSLAALGLTHLLESLLFGVGPRDPGAMAGAMAVLLAIAALACVAPAWRASRIEPIAALRVDG
ncbi:MAG: FtsX-like permease family protein [Gemmatimonadetes bacterium]|nr:FtsX-like permease family protein [Gemmatimonadota bacterium]